MRQLDMTKLTYTIRFDRDGNRLIAPFINGWNVWEIEEKHWTKTVQCAIKHAYELGYKHALSNIEVGNCPYILDQPFKGDQSA